MNGSKGLFESYFSSKGMFFVFEDRLNALAVLFHAAGLSSEHRTKLFYSLLAMNVNSLEACGIAGLPKEMLSALIQSQNDDLAKYLTNTVKKAKSSPLMGEDLILFSAILHSLGMRELKDNEWNELESILSCLENINEELFTQVTMSSEEFLKEHINKDIEDMKPSIPSPLPSGMK